MEKKLMLAPSMGCCDLYDFGHQVKFIDEHADFLHIDIKDGNYVKCLNACEPIVFHIPNGKKAQLLFLRPTDGLSSFDFLYEGANFPYKEDKQQQINFHYGCKVKTFWPKAGEKSGCLLGSSIGKDICLSSRKEWFDSITEYNKPEVQGNEHAGYVETSQYTSKLSPVRNRWSESVIPSCW